MIPKSKCVDKVNIRKINKKERRLLFTCCINFSRIESGIHRALATGNRRSTLVFTNGIPMDIRNSVIDN